MSVRISGLKLPRLGSMRRTTLVASAAVLIVGISGGVALASDSSPSAAGQIKACYRHGEKLPRLVVSAQGTCPRGFDTLTWNIQGPAGPAGATGATGAPGPRGPAGVSEGVTTSSTTRVVLDEGPGAATPVLTSPAVATGGVYYVSASVTVLPSNEDHVACMLAPNAQGSTAEEIGNFSNDPTWVTLSLAGALTLSAGDKPTVLCTDENSNPLTDFGEGAMTSMLIGSSISSPSSVSLSHPSAKTTHIPFLALPHA